MKARSELVFPFSALVGQDQMKTALLLNAVNPKIGGVLIRGEKGTAKSMAVRSLAQLLPEIEVVVDCPFRCDPGKPDYLCDRCASRVDRGEKLETMLQQVRVVDLPVGATEDRVTGTLDIEQAIKTGEKHFFPGLLADANRGILYVDEVNLLDDHMVDILLDAAAMGVNFVEREGISFSHPSEFILVGTMNPEEGELRPQLLDRFGLAVEVKGIRDQKARAEIVRRRLSFEEDTTAFAAKWEQDQEKLRHEIEAAKRILPEVTLSSEMLDLITTICLDFSVDGHRADIVIYKTARTLAALGENKQTGTEDIKKASNFALLHRQRRQPFDKAGLQEDQLDKILSNWQEKKN